MPTDAEEEKEHVIMSGGTGSFPGTLTALPIPPDHEERFQLVMSNAPLDPSQCPGRIMNLPSRLDVVDVDNRGFSFIRKQGKERFRDDAAFAIPGIDRLL